MKFIVFNHPSIMIYILYIANLLKYYVICFFDKKKRGQTKQQNFDKLCKNYQHIDLSYYYCYYCYEREHSVDICFICAFEYCVNNCCTLCDVFIFNGYVVDTYCSCLHYCNCGDNYDDCYCINDYSDNDCDSEFKGGIYTIFI